MSNLYLWMDKIRMYPFKIPFTSLCALLLVVCASTASAQSNIILLRKYQDSLFIASKIAETSPSNEERELENLHFQKLLGQALLLPESFQFSFDSLKSLSKLSSADNAFRIYSWVLRSTDENSYKYFGFVQLKNEKDKQISVIPLIDSSKTFESAQSAKLTSLNWYGAYYFKIIQHSKGKKKQYTLLGWKGEDSHSTKKLIDAMTIEDGKVYFGSLVFPEVNRKDKKSKKMYCRLIFEYSGEAIMTMRYEELLNMIIFDHLSPSDPSMVDIKSSYGPDFSFDAIQFKNGKWIYIPDMDARNINNTDGKSKRKGKVVPIYKPK